MCTKDQEIDQEIVRFTMLMTREQRAALKAIARQNHRTANGQIRYWITEAQKVARTEASHDATA